MIILDKPRRNICVKMGITHNLKTEGNTRKNTKINPQSTKKEKTEIVTMKRRYFLTFHKKSRRSNKKDLILNFKILEFTKFNKY